MMMMMLVILGIKSGLEFIALLILWMPKDMQELLKSMVSDIKWLLCLELNLRKLGLVIVNLITGFKMQEMEIFLKLDLIGF